MDCLLNRLSLQLLSQYSQSGYQYDFIDFKMLVIRSQLFCITATNKVGNVLTYIVMFDEVDSCT